MPARDSTVKGWTDGRTDERTDGPGGGNHKATMRRGEERLRRGWTRGAEEEEDGERRPRGCQCGLWKRVSKFNLTECRGVQPPPHSARYIPLHPDYIPLYPVLHCRDHLLCILRSAVDPAVDRIVRFLKIMNLRVASTQPC